MSNLALVLLSVAASPFLPELSSSPIDRELAAVLPTAAEDRWLTIPWRTSLPEAMDEARRVNKPMFLWVMNGNPLGCA